MAPDMYPTAGAGRMGERHGHRAAAGVLYRVGSTNELVERGVREKPRNRQAANRNHEARPNDAKLIVQPPGTSLLLMRAGNPIPAPARTGPRIAARGSGSQLS